MSFESFLMDEDNAEKRRKEVENVILSVVKANLIDKQDLESGSIITFSTGGDLVIKDAICKVSVILDYYKKVYKGMHRAIYINISHETNSYRSSDYIQIDLSDINDPQYALALTNIKSHFQKIVGKTS